LFLLISDCKTGGANARPPAKTYNHNS
jgi:hypothetical protein